MLPERKNPRLKNYDYGSKGAYFLTLCSKGKTNVFSQIVGRGILDAPEVRLTEYGKCVDDTIKYLSEHRNDIAVEKYVIMPNHLHLLVSIVGEKGGASGMPRPTNEMIPEFVSSLKRFTNKKCGVDLWQVGYHDHIVRDGADYSLRWRYIDDNPRRWTEDNYYCE